MKKCEKTIIGRNAVVHFEKEVHNVPAKVDTGADSSAVWATDIFVDENHLLHYKLFGEGSPYYSGVEHVASKYSVALTKSSSGDMMLKYRTRIPVELGGRKMLVNFGLSDRSTHNYPILIGRKTLHGKFLVDVEREDEAVPKARKKASLKLNEQMNEDPYKFYKEYYLKFADNANE